MTMVCAKLLHSFSVNLQHRAEGEGPGFIVTTNNNDLTGLCFHRLPFKGYKENSINPSSPTKGSGLGSGEDTSLFIRDLERSGDSPWGSWPEAQRYPPQPPPWPREPSLTCFLGLQAKPQPTASRAWLTLPGQAPGQPPAPGERDKSRADTAGLGLMLLESRCPGSH